MRIRKVRSIFAQPPNSGAFLLISDLGKTIKEGFNAWCIQIGPFAASSVKFVQIFKKNIYQLITGEPILINPAARGLIKGIGTLKLDETEGFQSFSAWEIQTGPFALL